LLFYFSRGYNKTKTKTKTEIKHFIKLFYFSFILVVATALEVATTAIPPSIWRDHAQGFA